MNTVQNPSRSAAYETLQSVIVRLATQPPVPRTEPRSPEFKSLVEQALQAYRNYMRAVEMEKAS